MKKAMDRLWEVVFTPSIRYYRMPNPEVRYPRTPAPASEPINHEINHMDYKVAFRDSTHQIRYHKDLLRESLTETQNFIADAISDTKEDKLVKFGFLESEQRGNQEAVKKAEQQYRDQVGDQIDHQYHFDEFGYSDKPITKDNRESVAHFVRHFVTATKDRNADEAWLNDLEDIYNPKNYHFKTYDMAADDAVFRQLKCDLEWHLDLCTQKKEEQGFMPKFQGDPQYWNILDNSFSAENIKLMQSHVGDTQTVENTQLQTEHNTCKYQGQARMSFPFKSELA